MTTLTISRTDEVLASMLVENTGRHFLDSGGAYGRSWERNQAAVKLAHVSPVEFFLSTPEAWQGHRGEGWGIISVFHFLRDRLDYHEKMDRAWRMWVYTDRTERWENEHRYLNSAGTMAAWVKAMADKGWVDIHDEWSGGGNTYNHESAVSQDFMWQEICTTDDCPFTEWPTTMVAVSIHNGCDARGGYTGFRLFEVSDYEPYSLFDFGSYEVGWECDSVPDPNQLALDGVPAPDGPHHIHCDVRSGDVQWYQDGYDIDEPEELDADEVVPDNEFGLARRCPCGGVLTVTGWYQPSH